MSISAKNGKQKAKGPNPCEPVTITTTPKALMAHVAPADDKPLSLIQTKVAVIGAGTVGTSIAFALLAQGVTTDLVLLDLDQSLAYGEILDIEHAKMYLGGPKINATNNYDDLGDSVICIIAAGLRGEDESKEEAAKRNTEIFKEIVPHIVEKAPGSIILVVSNPVEIMTYVAWKLSKFIPQKVMGLGTVLESASFRRLIAEKMGCSMRCIQAFIIGEQGKNSVAVWSSVSVSGVRLKTVNPDLGTEDDPEDWGDMHKQVIHGSAEVSKLKALGSWGISLSVARIVKVILEDRKECMPVSTHIKGCRHGIDKDVFMSLPCIIGKNGVEYMVRQDLNEDEKDKLQTSADTMNEIQKRLDIKVESDDEEEPQ